MTNKTRAYLDLVRIPNLFTAVADVLAGFAYAGGHLSDWPMLVLLAAASACLYAGGVALNDVCDVEPDARHRPDRPIPSGRITRGAAQRLAVSLLLIGLVLATLASFRSGITALALVVSIVGYNAMLKRTPVAPPLMGLCRALNFLLPMAGLGAPLAAMSALAPAALLWLYITSVTVFARNEATGARRMSVTVGTIGLCLAVAGLAGLRWTVAEPHSEYLIIVILLVSLVGYRGLVCVRRPEPASVQRAVKFFVVSLIGFDACIAWVSRGAIAAVLVAGMLIPTVILGRHRGGFRMT